MALDDLIRYESAAVAAINVEKEKDLAVLAMENQYRIILGKDFDEDPIIKRSLEEASAGGKQNITNIGIVQAMSVYSNKYENLFNSAKFSDLIQYLTEGYNISDEVKGALSDYSGVSLIDLMKKAKEEEMNDDDKKKIQKAITAISMLKERRLRAKTMEMYDGVVKKNLGTLYPKEENKEGDEE